jgi:hypothetical protein
MTVKYLLGHKSLASTAYYLATGDIYANKAKLLKAVG